MALGNAANNVGNVLLLVLLFYAFTLLLGDRVGLMAVVVITTIAGIVLFVAAGGFALDTLQLRGKVDQQAIGRFDMASSGAMFKFIVQGVISVLFAFSAWKSLKSAKREYLREQRAEEAILVRSATPKVN